MTWKKTIPTFVITALVSCTGLSQETRQTRELREKIRVESNLVVLSVTVKDDRGKLVAGLLKDDFHVFDDEVEQSILAFTDESLPLSLLILVDDDLKWKEGTQMARSVRSIIGDIAAQDEVMVCRFDMLFYPGDEFTSDSTKLMAALKSAQSAAQPSAPYIPEPLITDPVSTTGPPPIAAPTYAGSRPSKALEDALYSSAQLLQQRPNDRRRIILILTDGLDEPKLNHHSPEAVRDLLLQDNISVYALATGSSKSKHKFFNLTDYSSKTGGGIFFATSTYTMELTLSRMTEQARHDYTLVYAPTGNNASAKFHTLRVTAGSGYHATTRSSYDTSSDTPNP
ncbi:MAG: VWA domain-containing protein [Candidatus Acidiferrum sp.]|jgi:VWFA-related protein